MTAERKAGFAPRTVALTQALATMHDPCVGCEGCRGLCEALIEVLLLPEIVLAGRRVP